MCGGSPREHTILLFCPAEVSQEPRKQPVSGAVTPSLSSMDPSWQLLCLTAYPVSDTLITPCPQVTLSSYLSDFSCFAGCLLPYQLDLRLMSTPGEFIPVCSWSVLCAQHCSRHWNRARNNTGPDLCPLSPCSFGAC